jgi:Right handed beta helix region
MGLRWLILILCVGLSFFMGCPSAGAAAPKLIIHVNGESAQAADTHPGTESLPLKTIAAALQQAVKHRNQGEATQIFVHPGIYRESLALDLKESLTAAAIALEGSPVPQGEQNSVIVTGSEVWENWQPYQQTPIYSHPWPFEWGVADNPWTEYKIDLAPIVRRSELVFINDILQKQVLSFADLRAGSFYVDQLNHQLYLYPSDRLNLSEAIVEVATQNSVLTLQNASNITLKGITFEHSAGSFSAAVRIAKSRQILIQNCRFLWNNWAGLSLSKSEDITLENSQASHNGLKGISADHIHNLSLTDITSSFNNWRGSWGNFYDWDAGEKYLYIHGGRFLRYQAIANLAAGLWLDTDNRNIQIDQAYLANNAVTGLFLEASPGPISVKNSIICNNYQIAANYLQTPGLFAWSAANVTVENNLIFGNDFAQIGVRDLYPRQVEGQPNPAEMLVSQDWQIRRNLIINTRPDQKLFVTLKAAPFLDTLRSDHNIWFLSPGKPNLATAQTPFQIEQRLLTFQQWQSDQLKDQNSIFLDPQTQPLPLTSRVE